MIAIVQRVDSASVTVDGEVKGKANKGLLVLVGVGDGDTTSDAELLASKVTNLRIFTDENDKMNLSLIDVQGEMLIVSQFTLCGDCKKGTRPSFDKSAPPQIANELYEKFVDEIKTYGIKTQTGKFAAMMDEKRKTSKKKEAKETIVSDLLGTY